MSHTLINHLLVEMKNTATQDRFFEKKGAEWHAYNGQTIIERVHQLERGLAALGYRSGDYLAIQSSNCLRWILSDYAIAALGGVSVSIYPSLPADQIAYIVKHSEVRLAFAEDVSQVEKLLSIIDDAPMLDQIVCFDDEATFADKRVLSFQKLMDRGQENSNESSLQEMEDRIAATPADNAHTLLYTSGTTGVPKGVSLSSTNLLANVEGCHDANPIERGDRFLSFLPLSHIFERTGQYYAILGGGNIYFCGDMTQVAKYLPEVNPMVMFAVPRFFEKIYAGVMDKFESGSALKRKIASWALKVGYAYEAAEQTGEISAGLRRKRALADKLVFSKVRDRLGNSLKHFICGGAPLSRKIAEFFKMIGVTILEGYGLTECSPVVSGNQYRAPRVGTSGPLLFNVEVSFGPDQEILVKGDSVFKGYFKEPEANAASFDAEGWFHTGDLGALEDGHLRITGRKKNIIITSGGKNVMPTPLEDALEIHPHVDQVIAVGNQRKFISALIVPSFDKLQEWADKRSLSWSSMEELISFREVQDHFQELVEKSMEGFARYEQIKKFIVLHTPFSIEDGTLTPKLSIRREQIEERYQYLIDALYRTDPAI